MPDALYVGPFTVNTLPFVLSRELLPFVVATGFETSTCTKQFFTRCPKQKQSREKCAYHLFFPAMTPCRIVHPWNLTDNDNYQREEQTSCLIIEKEGVH